MSISNKRRINKMDKTTKIRWTNRNIITHQSKKLRENQFKNEKIEATS